MLWTITPVFYVTSSCLILCLHTGPPFCQHGKYALQLLVKHATNCRIVMLLVAENDIAKTKNYDSGRNNHTGQCKSTGGCYNELAVAYFGTGGGVK